MHGPAEAAGAAIAYAREGGVAFWTKTASGYEEWLLLEAGIACPGAEVAAWEVEGGTLRQRGDAIEVVDAGGRAQLRVTAPKAYAAGGREVEARISIVEGRISITVDAGCEAALVDPAWELTGDMLGARQLHTETLLPDGRVLVTGGTSAGGLAKAAAEAWSPATETWAAVATMSSARASHEATLLNNGKVLVTGGWINGVVIETTEVYDPQTNVWAPAAPMAQARFLHTATRLQDGKVLVAGGLAGDTLKSAELYDPATNTWAPLPPMLRSRFWHTATLLLDGRVLVWGAPGTEEFPTLNSPFEIFDPATKTWYSPEFSEPTRQRHTATLLPNGNVLIAGGEINGEPLGTVQVFEPAGEGRSFTTPLLTPRSMHTATLLPDGNVLVVGGYTPNGPGVIATATTEMFYPSNTRWSFSAALNDARDSHTATLLPDTRVLVAGGKGISALNSAEIFGAALGDPCQTVKDCPSGHCVEGICCDTACDLGQCDACSVASGASQDGQCEILEGAACDDGLACTAGDSCDASGACMNGAPITCSPSGECMEAACDFTLGMCAETPKNDGAYCSVGACKGGACLESPATGTGGAGGAGGAGGSGGEPLKLDVIYVQGGCICGMPGRTGSSTPSFGLGSLAALGLLMTRRVSRRRDARNGRASALPRGEAIQRATDIPGDL
jgi:hypothetical protein